MRGRRRHGHGCRRVVRAAAIAVLLAVLAAPPSASGEGAPPPADQPILSFLDQAISWYRQQLAQAQLAADPSDVVFAEAIRRQARQVLQLAFAFARADAALQPQPAPKQAPVERQGEGVGLPGLEQMALDAESAVKRAQATVAARQRRLGAASGRRRAVLRRQLAEARSELSLARARHQTLATYVDFVRQAGSPGPAAGPLAQIEELQRSVPEVSQEGTPPSSAPRAASAAVPGRAAPSGIVALATDLLARARGLSALRDVIKATTAMRQAVDKIRAPLLADLRDTLQRGEQLSNAAGSTDPAVLSQRTHDIDQLTAHFKAVSAAVVPLGKAAVLLDTQGSTLKEWRASDGTQYQTVLRALAIRLALLAIAIAAILTASAFWRRATFRYVHDLRRRQQSLLVRRIVVAAAIVILIAFSFVTEIGSLATFAGFMTAGLAVALQTVILSVAAYFFLIGKYGIRVGDRVQISGVTGDVIDIGLVRLHLMELRADGLPTGRVVVFSNSVLFQPTANFFKQIPGSNFAWHQVTLTVSPDTDYRYAERRLMDAVESVYAEYRERIVRQHQEMSQNISLAVREPRPQSQLRLTETGLEMTIQFPVPLETAALVDDQTTRALLDAVAREPRLKLVGSGTPTIQAAPGPAPA